MLKRKLWWVVPSISFIMCAKVLASCANVSADAKLNADIEAIVKTFKEKGALPGVSISVVNGQEAIYCKGFGYSDIEEKTLATEHTRYYLKSVTKSFLGLLAARLHVEDKIDLQAPISNYLPDLKLPEPLTSKYIPLQSHFTHTMPYYNSGLAYRTAWLGNIESSDFIDHTNTYAKATDIKFRYSNFGPIMGALAIEQRLEQTWQQLMRQQVFEPLGMFDSFTSMSKAREGDVASVYTGGQYGNINKSLLKHDSQMHAAGGTVSTVSDLAKWISLNLSLGLFDGEQLLPKEAFKIAHAQMVQTDWQFLEFHRHAHGLGVYHADYEGDRLMHHFGGESHVSFMPEHNLGIAILTNETEIGVLVTHRLAASIYDYLLNKDNRLSKIEERLLAIEKGKQRYRDYDDKGLKKLNSKAKKGEDLLAPEMLSGNYRNKRLGDISVFTKNDTTWLQFGIVSVPMRRLGQDYYAVQLEQWGGVPFGFQFEKNTQGQLQINWGGRLFIKQ